MFSFNDTDIFQDEKSYFLFPIYFDVSFPLERGLFMSGYVLQVYGWVHKSTEIQQRGLMLTLR